jgi:hypothetical protein
MKRTFFSFKLFYSLLIGIFISSSLLFASPTKMGRLWEFVSDPNLPEHITERQQVGA